MSRPTVFAEQFTDPSVAGVLRQHREDRQVLLRSLTASLQADPRVRAAWLWGSFGRGEADDLSDLDPWIIVSDHAAADFGAYAQLYAERTGRFVSGGEKPKHGPPGGGSFGSLHEGRHGLLHVDCYWQPLSAISEVPAQGLLFDRLTEPVVSPVAQPPEGVSHAVSASEGEDSRVAGGLEFAWLMFSIAAKYLARDPSSDMGLIFYPQSALEEAATLLGQEALGPLDWVVPEEPIEKVGHLRHLVGHVERLRLAANAQRYVFPPSYTPCLLRYLDMVKGIVKAEANGV